MEKIVKTDGFGAEIFSVTGKYAGKKLRNPVYTITANAY